MTAVEKTIYCIEQCFRQIPESCEGCLRHKENGDAINCMKEMLQDTLALLKERKEIMQCLKEKCCICPHCANCDVDENGSLKKQDKKGAWRDYEGMLTCSVCGAEFYKEIMEYCGNEVPHFCPDCGAEMVGI